MIMNECSLAYLSHDSSHNWFLASVELLSWSAGWGYRQDTLDPGYIFICFCHLCWLPINLLSQHCECVFQSAIIKISSLL